MKYSCDYDMPVSLKCSRPMIRSMPYRCVRGEPSALLSLRNESFFSNPRSPRLLFNDRFTLRVHASDVFSTRPTERIFHEINDSKLSPLRKYRGNTAACEQMARL